GSGKTGTYTASWDGDGNLRKQTMPGGISQVQAYDESGNPTRLAYEGPVKAEDGGISTGTWVSWETVRDVAGRIVGEDTPDGDVLSGSSTVGERGAAYDRDFSYDRAGRLTQVTDITAPVGEVINTDPDEGVTTPVRVRKYTFDKNGNRTSLVTTVDGQRTSARAWAYDAADRVGVNAGYVYDGLGRQTSIPAVDAPKTTGQEQGSAAITIGYYDDDTAHTITRSGATTTIGLDPAGRRLNLTTTGVGATQNGEEVKHYVDDSDNPGYTTKKAAGNTVTTRYETTIGGDLALTITGDQVDLAVNNPHGDTVTTIPLTGDNAGTGIRSWAQYDEYGNQETETTPDTGATTYAWHGADQRALNPDTGLILMGARLYNPTTGLFTSTDPIPGGNTTTYTYPQDPINTADTSGEWPKWIKKAARGVKKAWKNPWVRTGVTVVSLAVPGGAVVRGGVLLVKGYRLYKSVKAGKRGLTASRGVSRVAGRMWTGYRGTKRSPYSFNNTGKYRLTNNNGRQYRDPTFKPHGKYYGWHSNFEKGKKNVHVKIKKGWRRR
ncbi:MAG: RHS repeat-associated core domain-containing protein, partial [Galactobacter sp.]